MLPESPVRKPMNIVSLDSYRQRPRLQPEDPEPPEGSPHPVNKWIRMSYLRMFLLGNGIWKIARFHRVTPSAVEAELREQLILRGAFKDRAA